jgi:hypothetical protein
MRLSRKAPPPHRFKWNAFALALVAGTLLSGSQQAFAQVAAFSAISTEVPSSPNQSPEELRQASREATDVAAWLGNEILPKLPPASDPGEGPAATTPTLVVRFIDTIPGAIGGPGARQDPFCREVVGYFAPELGTPDSSVVLLRTCLLPRSLGEDALRLQLRRTVAHEAFHAYQYRVHPDEERWIREGLAQVFEFFATRTWNERHVLAGLSSLETSLVAMDGGAPLVSPQQYGHQLLFFRFLLSRCGGWELFWDLVNPGRGVYGRDTIAHGLERHGSRSDPACRSFEAAVSLFELARAHNRRDERFADARARQTLLLDSTVRPEVSPLNAEEIAARALGPWTPLLLPGNLGVENLLASGGYARYWLQQESPYAAVSSLPAGVRPGQNDGGWLQLLLRLPDGTVPVPAQ